MNQLNITSPRIKKQQFLMPLTRKSRKDQSLSDKIVMLKKEHLKGLSDKLSSKSDEQVKQVYLRRRYLKNSKKSRCFSEETRIEELPLNSFKVQNYLLHASIIEKFDNVVSKTKKQIFLGFKSPMSLQKKINLSRDATIIPRSLDQGAMSPEKNPLVFVDCTNCDNEVYRRRLPRRILSSDGRSPQRTAGGI